MAFVSFHNVHRHKLISELALLGRFALVGFAATLIHSTAAWLLIEHITARPFLANFAAFCVALAFSFSGHFFWTFKRTEGFLHSLRRFLLIASAGFTFNMVALFFLLEAGWLSPAQSAAVSAFVVPAITFLASRLWGFSDGKK